MEVVARKENTKIDWLEYKTLRQYQTMSDFLSGGDEVDALVNGSLWLTKDP